MDYQEYLKKQDKNPEKPINNSISFEIFLKSKSFKDENPQNQSLSPEKPIENSLKTEEKTPPTKSNINENQSKLSESLKKMKQILDSSFKNTETKEERSSCF